LLTNLSKCVRQEEMEWKQHLPFFFLVFRRLSYLRDGTHVPGAENSTTPSSRTGTCRVKAVPDTWPQ
jgi:hypothetical protein